MRQVCSQPVSYLSQVLQLRTMREKDLASTHETLIVYTHGALSSKRSWNYIQKQVNRGRAKSKTAELYFEYDLQEEDAFLILSDFVNEIKKEILKRSPKKVIMVGHSFGGVLSVAAARELVQDLPNLEYAVITMAAPFAGARIAPLFTLFSPCSKFFTNIRHNSGFMWSFQNRPLACLTYSFITTSGGVRWIPGDNDGVVTRESQNHFCGDPMMVTTLIDMNHFEVLMSDNVAARITSEIINREPISKAA